MTTHHNPDFESPPDRDGLSFGGTMQSKIANIALSISMSTPALWLLLFGFVTYILWSAIHAVGTA